MEKLMVDIETFLLDDNITAVRVSEILLKAPLDIYNYYIVNNIVKVFWNDKNKIETESLNSGWVKIDGNKPEAGTIVCDYEVYGTVI